MLYESALHTFSRNQASNDGNYSISRTKRHTPRLKHISSQHSYTPLLQLNNTVLCASSAIDNQRQIRPFSKLCAYAIRSHKPNKRTKRKQTSSPKCTTYTSYMPFLFFLICVRHSATQCNESQKKNQRKKRNIKPKCSI